MTLIHPKRHKTGLIALAALLPLVPLLAACDHPRQPHLNSSPAAATPVATPAQQSGSAPANGDVRIPPMLEVTADSTHPGTAQIRVLPNLEGQAQLRVDSAQPLEWLTPQPPGLLKLKRGESPQTFKVRLKNPKAGKLNPLHVGLTILGDDGRPSINVDKTITLGPSTATTATTATQPSRRLSGVSGNGQPVQVYVPQNAPTPRVEAAP